MKYKTEMTFPVELTFEILPPMVVEDTELPAQLDITRILMTVIGPGGKPRQVDVTKSLSEEQMFLLEDEIVEHFTNENPSS
jgi:hypothetical protein